MINVSEENLAPWGRCIKITNQSIELFVTVDFGPRVIRFSKVGGNNVFFEDLSDSVNQKGLEDLFAEKYGADKGVWHIRGGHRLWTSPEIMPRNYYPDNEPVSYRKTSDGAVFSPPEQSWTHFKTEIEIKMSENSDEVTLNHKITNNGAFAAEFAPWAITVFNKGGKEIIPLSDKDTALLPNRFFSFWSYSDIKDKRLYLGDKFVCLSQDENEFKPFKMGINNVSGRAAYRTADGDLFIKYFPYKEGSVYPDGGMNFETYTSELILEIETLGELKSVQPNESACHTETWKFIKNVPEVSDDEAEIGKFAEKYI